MQTIGLLAGMIMLGLGGSSYTKDFAIRYLTYAFSVGMKLMALVMIAKIGSEVLIGLANDATVGDEFIGIDSVSHCSLFDILEAGRDAPQTAHAEIHEYFGSLRIFLHDIDNAHGFFYGCHGQHLLLLKVYHRRESSVLLDFLIMLQ